LTSLYGHSSLNIAIGTLDLMEPKFDYSLKEIGSKSVIISKKDFLNKMINDGNDIDEIVKY
jgi:hypothetical protein